MSDVLRSIPLIVLALIAVLAVAAGVAVYVALTFDPPASRARDTYEDWESETW